MPTYIRDFRICVTKPHDLEIKLILFHFTPRDSETPHKLMRTSLDYNDVPASVEAFPQLAVSLSLAIEFVVHPQALVQDSPMQISLGRRQHQAKICQQSILPANVCQRRAAHRSTENLRAVREIPDADQAPVEGWTCSQDIPCFFLYNFCPF